MQLRQYIHSNNISVNEFAASISVKRNAVYRYMRGESNPRHEIMCNILSVTNGQVTANDFYSSRNEHRGKNDDKQEIS